MELNAEQAEAVQVLRTITTNHPLKTWQYHGILAQLPEEESRYILIRAANRVGKTRAICAYASEFLRKNPGSRVRIIGPDRKHAQKIAGRYLAQFLRPYLNIKRSYYIEGRGWNGGIQDNVLLDNKSECTLLSTKMPVEAHSGDQLDLVIFDEPPTPEHYTENLARITGVDNARIIIAATMVNVSDISWIRDMVQGNDPDPSEGRTVHSTGWVQYVATFSRDNCPWYSSEQVQERKDICSASPWDYGQRIEAKWEGVAPKRVYVAIDNRHIREGRPPPGALVGIGMDHGQVAGRQAAILASWHGPRLWVLDEHLTPTVTTPETEIDGIFEMLDRSNLTPEHVDEALGDITSTSTDYRMNHALNTELRDRAAGRPVFQFHRADKSKGSVEWGVRLANVMANKDHLFIHPRCKNLIRCMRMWNGKRTGSDGEHSHISDAFRYILTKAMKQNAEYSRIKMEW